MADLMTYDVDVTNSLIVAIVVLGLGQVINARIKLLSNYNVPPSVTGGVLCSLLVALIDVCFDVSIVFDMQQRNTLLLIFFSTIGLSAKLSKLRKGGKALAIMAGLATIFLILQNTMGLTVAALFGADPFYGLIGGSISFSGGHGTSITWGQMAESMGLEGAQEVGLACATIGLVAGGIVGGPLSEQMIRRNKLCGDPSEESFTPSTDDRSKFIPVTLNGMLSSVLLLAICVGAGDTVNRFLSEHGYTVPGFLTALLVGVVLTNMMDYFNVELRTNAIGLCSDISLKLFLGLSLMSMQLAVLFNAAAPLAILTIAQVLLMAVFAYFIVFPLMGKDYDACVIATGYVGMGLGATPIGIANMTAVTEKYGASTKAFLVIPLIGAFFVDLANAVIVQGFLALPFLHVGG